MAQTAARWPFSVWYTCADGIPRSSTLSLEAVMSLLPSGVNSRYSTFCQVPRSSPLFFPVRVDQVIIAPVESRETMVALGPKAI